MPRDYKHRAQRRKKRKPVSPWLTLLAGLSTGLFVAFLVYIKMQPAGQHPVAAGMQTPAPEVTRQTALEPRKEKQAVIPPPPKPRFDFYTLLPEMEVVIPEQEIQGKTEAGIKQVEQPGTYYLQVGSFRSREQADRFKAELILLGLETSIQTVTINNTDTYHRVRVGPYQQLDMLNKTRLLLNKQGVDSTLIRIAE